MQDEWGASQTLIWQSVPFVLYTTPLLLPPHPCSPAACTTHSSRLCFWWKGPSQMSCAASSSCSWTSPFFSTKEERGPGSRCTFVWGPSWRFFCFLCPLIRVERCWLKLLSEFCFGEGVQRTEGGGSTRTLSHLICFYNTHCVYTERNTSVMQTCLKPGLVIFTQLILTPVSAQLFTWRSHPQSKDRASVRLKHVSWLQGAFIKSFCQTTVFKSES